MKSGAFYLGSVAWLSVFVEAWLLITEQIKDNSLAWGFWFFFLFVSIAASSVAMSKK